MPTTIGIIAIKGGVGKTTIASSLAADLVNHYGKKVLLVDANYSAPNLGLHMDIIEPEKTIHHVLSNQAPIKSAIHNRFGVDVIPGSYVFHSAINALKLKDKLKLIKNNYDFVIIDSSPSLNEETFSTMLASDNLFVVSTPDYPTLSCTLKATKLAKIRGTEISGIIINKIRNPKFELTLKEIEDATDIPVIAKIPDDITNIKALFTRIPTSVFYKKSKFSKEINRLSAALTNTKEKRSLLSLLFSSFKREQVNRQILKQNFYVSQFMSRSNK